MTATVPFSSAYLAGEARALALLPADYRDKDARCALVRRRAGRPLSQELLSALREQASPSPQRSANLDALATGAAAVVSGQQVGLFLGPLYTIYKAASAIATARALTAQAGMPCVPVFWLQSEDHDFAEIDHCHVLKPGAAPLRLALSPAGPSPRSSVAHLRLGAEVGALLSQLRDALSDLPSANEIIDLLSTHYRVGATLAGAFAGALSDLFREEGLIVFDPRRAMLGKLAAPLFRAALVQAEAIEAALRERGQVLLSAGFSEQVHPRPHSSLVFFHQDGSEGPRHRLMREKEGVWALAGAPEAAPLLTEELLALFDRDPLRLSTSALLRPLLQDALFPTAAYIGGPGELNYLAQLPPLYQLLGIDPPIFMPRARFRVLTDNTRALLHKLGLLPADAARPRDELRRACSVGMGERQAPEALREELLLDISTRLAALSTVEGALREPAQQAQVSIERTLSRLVERYGRVLLERDQVTTERVDRLRAFLLPDGIPQERFASLPAFAALHGLSVFKERLFTALVPFDATVRDLDL